MIRILDRDMRTVSYSQNLRGILAYSGKNTVERVDIWPRANGNSTVGIAWENGSTAIFDFASFTVCKSFFEKRARFNSNIKIHQGVAA